MKTIAIQYIKEKSPSFFIDLIIELGVYRKNNICPLCNKKIKTKSYNTQLCEDCRYKLIKRIKAK